MWVFRLSWQVLLEWWVFFCLRLQGYAEGWGSTFLVNVGTDLDPTQRSNPADYHPGKWCVKNKFRFVIKCVIKLQHTLDIFDPTAIPRKRDYFQPTGPTKRGSQPLPNDGSKSTVQYVDLVSVWCLLKCTSFKCIIWKHLKNMKKKFIKWYSFWADRNVMAYKLLECLMWIKIIGVTETSQINASLSLESNRFYKTGSYCGSQKLTNVHRNKLHCHTINKF